VTRSTTKVRVQGLYLGWRCCGEATLCRQTGMAWGYSGSALLCKTRKYCHFQKKKSAEPPLHGEVPKTYKKSSARWPATTQTSTSTHLTPQAYITTIYFNYEAIKPPPPTLHPPPSPLPPQPHHHFHLHKHLHLLHHNHTTTSTTITTTTQHNTTHGYTTTRKEKGEKRVYLGRRGRTGGPPSEVWSTTCEDG